MPALALTLCGNDADVIERFVRHHLPLVDLMVLVDQASSDGTHDILWALRREGLPILVIDAPDAALDAGALLARAWRLVVPVFQPDLVYLLRSQQVLRTAGRQALEADLATLLPGEVAWVPRVTHVPQEGSTEVDDRARTDPWAGLGWRCAHPSSMDHPLALRCRLDDRAPRIHPEGTPVATTPGRHLEATLLAEGPVRSLDQLQVDVVLGWPLHRARHGLRPDARGAYGPHALLDRLLTGGALQPSDLLPQALARGGHTGVQPPLVHDPLPPLKAPLRYSALRQPAGPVRQVLSGLVGWPPAPPESPPAAPEPLDLAPLIALTRELEATSAVVLANEPWSRALSLAVPALRHIQPPEDQPTPPVDLLLVLQPPDDLDQQLAEACDPTRIRRIVWCPQSPFADLSRTLGHWATHGWTPDLLQTLSYRARSSYLRDRRSALVLAPAQTQRADHEAAVREALVGMDRQVPCWDDPPPLRLAHPMQVLRAPRDDAAAGRPHKGDARQPAARSAPTRRFTPSGPVRSVLIAGAGRSGTSCLAGMFDTATHHHARDLYAPQVSNPKGFFEAAHINDLNESIMIASSLSRYGEVRTRELLQGHEPHQLWLARFPEDMPTFCTDEHRREIAEAVRDKPFCLKDPRLSLTLPAWLEQAPDALVLSIHRPPDVTAASILRECSVATYLLDYRISARDAFTVWHQAYRRLVLAYRAGADVRFLRYEDLFDDQRLELLEADIGVPLRRDFAERSLHRTHSDLVVAPEHRALYDLLEALSERSFLHDRAGDAQRIDAYLKAWPAASAARPNAEAPQPA